MADDRGPVPFEAAGVPCSPVNSNADALADPQVDFMGWVQHIVLPAGHRSSALGPVVRIDGAPPSLDGDRPDILDELASLTTSAWPGQQS